MVAALAYLKVTPRNVQGEQVAEVQDLRLWDPLLALYLEIVGSKVQNLKYIVQIVNGRKQLFLIIGLIILWTF